MHKGGHCNTGIKRIDISVSLPRNRHLSLSWQPHEPSEAYAHACVLATVMRAVTILCGSYCVERVQKPYIYLPRMALAQSPADCLCKMLTGLPRAGQNGQR